VSIRVFYTWVCRTDTLLLNWPGMSICKNSLEQRMSTRIALLAHLCVTFEQG